MRRIYHLSTCSTCRRFLASLANTEIFELRDIKHNTLTGDDLDVMVRLSGTYEALFSRRAIAYRTMKLNERELSETEIRNLILQEYTFLRRPVTIIEDRIFTGASAKQVEAINQLTSG